ncbi:MAG: cadherin repeat domain-containing protein, partial [Rhizobiales bacterium]|nr:cadherin repeat domain-containing protein [Hyphomicrobiales bacterium]
MSKDNTTNNTGDKSQGFSSVGKDQTAASSAQGQREYENLINKSLEEQISDASISRADITNPNLHYGIEEEVEKISSELPQPEKEEGKFLEQTKKAETEVASREPIEQDAAPIEELKAEQFTGNDVPQTPGNLDKVDGANNFAPEGTPSEEGATTDERTPQGETSSVTNPNTDGTPSPETEGEGETFNPDLITTGNSVDENATEGTVIATLDLEDAAGTVFVYFISDENGAPISNSNFNIVGNELIVSGTANLDFESLTSHDIFITGIDGNGNTVTEPFSIEINDINEFAVSAITDTDASTNSVAENVSVGTSVGITAFASDADGSNNGVTYSLSDDAGGLFAIDPNTGEVTVAGAIDYEAATNHNIEVTATSEDGSTSTQTFNINVENINESGVSAISDADGSANAVDEDASVGAVVGITALATDADATDTVTYSLSDDAGGLFTIDANTGVVTVASGLDAETATSHDITVVATSTDGSTANETFTINVNDVNETSISAIS